MPHVIRLGGPWSYQSLRADDSSPPPQRFTPPCDLSGLFENEAPDGLLLTRHFHRPTGVNEGDRVELSIGTTVVIQSVWLNDQLLVGREHRYEITSLLQPYNHLALQVAPSGAMEPAQLEIFTAAS